MKNLAKLGKVPPYSFKFDLKMKLTLYLLINLFFQVQAETYKDDVRITIHLENVTVEKALKEIELRTDYKILYNDREVDFRRIVSISHQNENITSILSSLFDGTPIQFEIHDKQIILTHKLDKLRSDAIPAGMQGDLAKIDLQRSVSGTVTDQDGQPLPGVSVYIENTSIGTTTDFDGNYTINVNSDAAVLVFTYIGMGRASRVVGQSTTIDVQLMEDAAALDEVVVTALGIERASKSLGYSTSNVDTEQLSETRTVNVGNSLQGRVAGLNVSPTATGPGGSAKIRIRGQSSFGGDNSPLLIVNGVPINNSSISGGFRNPDNPTGGSSDQGDGLQSINPDDIESINVLKGSAAAALYGFRAKDGAIIITTKTGRRQKGIGVEINSNFQIAAPLDYTDFQYEYGQGEFGSRPTTVAEAQSSGIWSFGERFDGQPTPQVDGSTKPYLPNRNRISDFYRKAIIQTNSVALSGGDDKGNYRLSFANSEAEGIVPNSHYRKNIWNLGLQYNITPKFSVQLNANYSNENNFNPPQVGIEGFSVNSTIYTMANSIDVNWLKKYEDENGNEMPLGRFTGRNNPYWVAYKHFEIVDRDRIFGNASLRYQFTDWLYALVRVGQDYYTRPYEFNRPTGSRNLSAAITGFNGFYYQDVSTFRESNTDFIISGNHNFGKIGVNVLVGGNRLEQTFDRLQTSVTNFYVRDLYTIGNGQIKNPDYVYTQKQVNSLYGSAEVSYNDLLFLNVTARNDWFSTLNPDSNSYLYPSVSGSFIFSDALSSKPSWLDYGKLRVAYAEVGGDTQPYANDLYYSFNPNAFNGTALGSISSSSSPNAFLRPLKVKETEVGLEIRTLDGRVNLDVAVYRKNTLDEILDVNISQSSGYEQTKVNVGRLRNEGIEMLLNLQPSRGTVDWETTFNAAYNKSEVLELADGQERFDVGVGQWFGTISHEVGNPLASVRSFDYRRDDQGRVITSAGKPLLGELKTFGSAIPTWTGAWTNTLRYKGFKLFTQVDFKFGAVLLSNSNFNMLRHGLSKKSLDGREDGVLFPGFNEDGSPNTTRVEAEEFYASLRNLGEPFVYDASFVRWRTLSLGYNIGDLFKADFLKSSTVSLFVNNVLMINKHLDNLDPEANIAVSDNFQGIDAHALPTTRNYGLNINIQF